jgi:hypothetical protein
MKSARLLLPNDGARWAIRNYRGEIVRVGIMQPYFMPYIGYFQLIAAVDLFIVYDNIKYTKKGWINRNRMLLNGSDAIFSLPLKKDSDKLNVVERELSSDFNSQKFLNQIRGAYISAPQFNVVWPLVEGIVCYEDKNLFRYIFNSIVKISEYLDLRTEIKTSSEIDINHELRNQDKVLALCEAVGGSTYVNTIGGVDLYEKHIFLKSGVELKFIKSLPFEYPQLGNAFVPWLSIIDVMMFNPLDVIQNDLTSNYELI